MKTFGTYLAELRKARKLSQGELGQLIHIHPSDLSKIEADKRNRPRAEIFRQIIDVLKLPHKEAEELAALGNYPPSVLEKFRLNVLKYPPVVKARALEKLCGDHGMVPAWYLSLNGIVIACNLLCFWLWNAIDPHEGEFERDTILGACVFEIYSRDENFPRIAPIERVSDFLYTKAVAYRLLEDFLPASAAAFKQRILSHAVASLVYEHAPDYLGNEWEYFLKIRPPMENPPTELKGDYLEFNVRVERVMHEDEAVGFVVTSQPLWPYTIKAVESAYEWLIQRYGVGAFVQGEEETQSVEQGREFPTFHAVLTHDLLWYITGANRTYQLLFGRLFGRSCIGSHVFELLTSEMVQGVLRQSVEETSALRALRYFFAFTEPYRNKDHRLHREYEQMMQRLSGLAAFRKLLTLFWKTMQPDTLGAFATDGEVACWVYVPCPFAEHITLAFTFIPYFPPPNEQSDYYVVHVPSNAEAKATLILLHLEEDAPVPEGKEETEFAQLLWGLAILRTVEEGLTRDDADTQWQPQAAFERIGSELGATVHAAGHQALEELTTQVQITFIGILLQGSISSKDDMLSILLQFSKRAPALYNLLAREQESMVEEPLSQGVSILSGD